MFDIDLKFPAEFITNFLGGMFNINGYYDAHKPFADSLKELNEFLEDQDLSKSLASFQNIVAV